MWRDDASLRSCAAPGCASTLVSAERLIRGHEFGHEMSGSARARGDRANVAAALGYWA